MESQAEETLVLISGPWLDTFTVDPVTLKTVQVDFRALAEYCVDELRLPGRFHINYYTPDPPDAPGGVSSKQLAAYADRKDEHRKFRYKLSSDKILVRRGNTSIRRCRKCKLESESAKEIYTLIACDVADEIIRANSRVKNFVIISGDGDIVPILNFIQKHGRRGFVVFSPTSVAKTIKNFGRWEGLPITLTDLSALPRT